MEKPYFIAEIGVNFYDTAYVEKISPLEAAKEYIKKAAESGVDAVKFQSYKADTIVSRNSPAYWDLTQEPTQTQYELFKKHDGFGETEYYELYKYSKECGVAFMSTPFDYASVDYLEKMVDIYKISSSDLNNVPFIRYIAEKGKPIYLSVGAAYLSEVAEAVHVIQAAGCSEICLMHCVLSYPTRYEDANLEVIRTLKRIFPHVKVGYSDHTLPDNCMSILSAAFLLGAEVIEKHFTLDKTLPGNDHYHAGDPTDFSKAVKNFDLICKATGHEEKTVFECEKISRREARRSLVLAHSLKKGELIKKEDLIAKRPGTGISPEFSDIVVGRSAKEDLPEDTVLTWKLI